jgi:hypothetical protein
MPTASAADRKTSVQQIIADTAAARADLAARQMALDAAYNEILDRGYDRDLTAAEQAQLRTLNDAIASLFAANRELALVTVRLLNEAPEIQRLTRTLGVINQDLETRLKEAQKAAKALGKAAGAVKIVAKVIAGLTKLL